MTEAYGSTRAIYRRAMRKAGYRGSKSHDNVKPHEDVTVAWVARYLVETAKRDDMREGVQDDCLPVPSGPG